MIDIHNIPDGVHTDISIEDYHANKTHVSSTVVKYAKESLKHYDWYRNGKLPQAEKSHFAFGNAFELALLAQNEYKEKVAIRPEGDWIAECMKIQEYSNVRNTKKYKELADEFDMRNRGKYFISETGSESFETIQEMLSSCYQDKVIQGLISNTEYQLSLFWTDEQSGVRMKTRPDICKRKKNVIVNLKTTLDGSPEAFSKDINKYDYALQACIESRGCVASGIMPTVDNYFWLVVEKVAPFNATIYEFTQSDLNACMDNLDFLLNKIARAEKQNLWPGYSERADNKYGILNAKIPLWYNY
jgi:hypothetical protein